MKIQRATFLGVRGVADATLDLTDPRTGAPHGAVVISGPSGSGKTRLLEALIAAKETISPYGFLPQGAAWIGDSGAAKIVITFHLDEAERQYAGAQSTSLEGEVIFLPERSRVEADEGLRAVLDRYSHDPAQGKLEYFPATRQVTRHPPFASLGTAEQRLGRAAKDPRKYSFVVTFLRSLEFERARAERFAARLAAFSPTLRFVPGTEPEALPRCLSSRGGPPVTPFDLSDGETDAVIFAATSIVVGLDHSIVLIDRPDLHADDLGHLVSGLEGMGQDNQLLLTGRPELAAAAGGALVVTLKGS